MRRHHLHSKRGSALILVLWALVIMGIAVLGLIDLLQISMQVALHRRMDLEAEMLARTGIALGENSSIKRDDPILIQTVSTDHSYKVTILSEGSRLNLNFLLQTHNREILSNLFTRWGLTAEQCDHVIDCLNDWITPSTGDIHSLNGATDEDYAKAGLPQRPSHRPFQSLDEVEEVMDFDLVEKKKPGWRDYFTLWSSGPLNVNEASPELIDAVTQAGIDSCKNFVDVRNGADHLVGTDDDQPVNDLASLQIVLGASAEDMQLVAQQISFSDSVRRVESTGEVEGRRVTLEIVFRQDTSPLQILSWARR